MDKKIIVQIKNVYGNQTIYPISREAKIFASLVKQTTLTMNDIAKIKELGYEVEVQPEIIKL